MNILVTGAGKGLGLALVKKFAEEPGNTIIAVSRNIENLNGLVQAGQHGKLNFSQIIPYSFDLVKDDYQELISFVMMHVQQIDVLINNAGYLVNKSFLKISDAEFDTTFNTNVKTVFNTVKNLYPLFVRNTHIVNISSMGGFQGSIKFPGLSVYSASKSAVIALTECLATELSDQGIYVNALAIGSVQTEMLAEAFPGYTAPLSASQMADFITHFASHGQRYFNGKVLPVALSTP